MSPNVIDDLTRGGVATPTAPARATIHGRYMVAPCADERGVVPTVVQATSPGWGQVTWSAFGMLQAPTVDLPRPVPPLPVRSEPSGADRLLAAPIQERVRVLGAALSLNKSLLAEVLQVSRPTIYEWLQGHDPTPTNLERITQLLRCLGRHGVGGNAPLNARFVRHPIDEGASLLDELRRPRLDERRLDELVEKALCLDAEARAMQAERERRWREGGFEELSDDERKANLAQNVAMLDWPQ